MEDLALAKATCFHRGSDSLRELVGNKKELQALPDWSRILLSANFSVDDGHLAMRFGPALELAEIGAIFKLGDKSTLSDHVRAINLPMTSSLVENGRAAVISDGDWAQYFRRHILLLIPITIAATGPFSFVAK